MMTGNCQEDILTFAAAQNLVGLPDMDPALTFSPEVMFPGVETGLPTGVGKDE